MVEPWVFGEEMVPFDIPKYNDVPHSRSLNGYFLGHSLLSACVEVNLFCY